MYQRLKESKTRMENSIEEHRKILEAICSRDAQEGSTLMANHFARVV